MKNTNLVEETSKKKSLLKFTGPEHIPPVNGDRKEQKSSDKART